jgi:tetratricopeptide (TPR) repeat protein
MLLVDTMMGIATDLVEVRPPANEDGPGFTPDTDALVASYYELRDRFIQERDAGNLQEVLRLCNKALALADQIGDEALVDQAYCNLFGSQLTLGFSDLSFSKLREILMRNRSLRTAYSAAYLLACSHTIGKQYKKALFYAQIARQRALALNETALVVQSHNEIGRCYLSESYFEKAIIEFEKALCALPDELTYTHVAPLGNLGYTKLLVGDYRSGFKYLHKTLRHCSFRSTERGYFQEWIHLYLCFGYIEIRRWRYAWRHGVAGLKLAEKNDNSDAVKNALYLLGEVEKSVGDFEAARGYFSRLQREFYPDNPELVSAVLAFQTKDLVNLRA